MNEKQMMRRDALKLLAVGAVSTSLGCSMKTQPQLNEKVKVLEQISTDNWGNTYDRTWLGGEYWANPMEDWHVVNGTVECLSRGGNRSIHSLVHQLIAPEKAFKVSVRTRQIAAGEKDGGVGLRFGARSDLNEYRSNCFIQAGLDVGIIDGQLAIAHKRAPLKKEIGSQEVELTVTGTPQSGAVTLQLSVNLVETGELVGQFEALAAEQDLLGNVALVSNFAIASVDRGTGGKPAKSDTGRYRFSHWNISGQAFNDSPKQKFGPILWTMYTLSDTRSSEGFVMKLSALTGPMGKQDSQQVELQVQKGGTWQSIATEQLNTDAWLATFRIANWDEKQETPFRVIYLEKQKDGSVKPDVWDGKIKANPVGRNMRMAALTCQNDYAFPYEPVANNVIKMDPDLVFFSGDQLYETHGGFGIIRAPANKSIINYLRKFYQFGWAFAEAMRNSPTICLPDDHDVLQGNMWGEGGKAMAKDPYLTGPVDKDGGYIQPVRMLNVVHLTNTAHHFDAIEPKPSAQGLSVYYGEIVYGDVGFAIVADRQWKSGPEHLNIIVGKSGEEEEPTYINPDFDRQDLQLLGDRQETFLKKWSNDWRGHKLKAVLSQTVFASLATHQWKEDYYLKYDFDSNGWPATARNRGIDAIRNSKALHICGDTHLASVSQYGVTQSRDSNWVYCTPAIAVGWQRWWVPDQINLPFENRPAHGLAHTGEYLDSFGNKNYVYAVGNPEFSRAEHRYVIAHEKASGFGFITFDTKAKTYTLEAYKFMVDVADGKASNQFDGWPLTIHQEENLGINRIR